MAHQEIGIELMKRIKEDLSTMAATEQEPKLMGRNVTMILGPLPANKRKRRFASHHDLPDMPEDEEDEADDE
jgi:translation initiation factor IF-3